MKTLVMRCAAALLAASFLFTQSWAQEKDKPSMPGMPMPKPTPKPTPTPSPAQTPAPAPQTPAQKPATGMSEMEMPQTKPQPSTGQAANPQAAPQTGSPAAAQDTTTLPNLSNRSGWPSPTADDAPNTFRLFDLLEYQRAGGVNTMRWDFLGWRGGDRNRFWFKSEGELNFASPLGGEADLQLLYGRQIAPFFDLQTGVRVEQHYERESKPKRVFFVIGLQGLAPGRFEVEPALFISNKGKVSGRFTGSLDLYQTQRWIWQPRLETEFAAQRDDAFGVERGISDIEVGVRLRYEIRREYAPYFGVSYRQSVGATRARVSREGGATNAIQVVVGIRTWR